MLSLNSGLQKRSGCGRLRHEPFQRDAKQSCVSTTLSLLVWVPALTCTSGGCEDGKFIIL